VYHLYVVRSAKRDQLRTFLTQRDIHTLIHYPAPVHYSQPIVSAYPVALTGRNERVASTILSLPIYPELSKTEVQVLLRLFKNSRIVSDEKFILKFNGRGVEMMNILILGGAGFLGNHLVRYCLGHPGNRVTVVDSLEPRLRSTVEGLYEVWSQIQFIQGDMGNEALIAQVVKGKDIIFNCAAQTSHPLSLQDPLFDTEINCLGNLKLLEMVRQHNKQAVVVYTSSSTVIGRADKNIVDETHYERPLDIYSANKGVAEKYYRNLQCGA